MADTDFDNEAGQWQIFLVNNNTILRIQNRPNFDDESEVVRVEIPNLKYVGVTENQLPGGGTQSYHTYTFGTKNNNRLEIILGDYPTVQFGGYELFTESVTLYKFPDLDETFEFFTALHNSLQAEVKRQAKLKGRNIASLKKTLLAPVSEYSKAQNVLTMPGIGNKVASFLSGKPGSLNQQVAALKKNAGVPNARRRKTRRNRK